MAEEWISGGVSGGVGGAIVMALTKLLNYFRGRDKEADAKQSERDQWDEINAVKTIQNNSSVMLGRMDERMTGLEKKVDETHADVKTLLRRSTGKVDK